MTLVEKTIGVALNVKERKKSEYIHEEFVFDKLNPRQDKLISMADAYIALPGGIGTLYEVIAVLALKRLNEIPKDKPLILVDKYFKRLETLFKEMIGEGFVEESLSNLYTLVETPSDAIVSISDYFEQQN